MGFVGGTECMECHSYNTAAICPTIVTWAAVGSPCPKTKYLRDFSFLRNPF